ncbi:MAG TPA: VOC family protein [Rhizomicrobium sp.]|nr:VOC family protein [Rhizomicrobium sp.]
MAKSISPFLMFEGAAEAAMNFYVSLFAGASIQSIARFGPEGPGKEGSVMTGILSLNGQTIMFLDSPVKHAFTFTPAISLFVECQSVEEIDRLFAVLSDGGQVLMPLDAYPFAQRFGWTNDRFGVSWQLRFS